MLEGLARIEHQFRPFIERLPVAMQTQIYSSGRRWLMHRLALEDPPPYIPPPYLERKLWGITHQGPLMWAAGIDKEGKSYHISSQQGAAAHIVGTTTANPRTGSVVEGILNPFLPLPRSHAAMNNLGLPNPGDEVVATRVRRFRRRHHCPVWASVMASPDLLGEERLEKLVSGMHHYASAGVNYIELNLSCPNTGQTIADHDLFDHDKILRYVSERFIRESNAKVGLKESADLPLSCIPRVCDLAFALGFVGLNGVNTSKDYPWASTQVHDSEQDTFAGFSGRFKGGLSGRALKDRSLAFCSRASDYLRQGPPSQEFHIIRTGGIETGKDLIESDQAGASINQWITGYWEKFAVHGHKVYRRIHEEYREIKHGR